VTAPHPQIRIGYAERSAAQEALDEHLTAGRLDPDEYADRYAAAEIARTQAELDALFTDLPAPHPSSGHATLPVNAGPGGYRRDWYSYIPESSVGRIAALIAVVVAVILVFPLAIAAVVLYFVVLPRLTYGRRWGYPGGPMWGWSGRSRQWRR
jgi:Domain of unknown function (DUF1707)